MFFSNRTVLSFFGSGLIPWAPGTMGSLASWCLGYGFIVLSHVSCVTASCYLILLGFICLIVGIGYSYAWLKHNPNDDDDDPSWIVIDEAAAVFLGLGVLCFLSTSNLLSFGSAVIFFILFRLFDILKPWPISWVEKTLKGNPWRGAWGIMMDDVMAGLLAVVVHLVIHAFTFSCLSGK